MTQQYGTVKCDVITFTSGTTGNETDVSITVSGLGNIQESGITITGNITGDNITATGDLTVSGIGQFASGTAAAPGITFIGDNDLGLFTSAANTLNITTSGSTRATILENGNVGIGTSSPAQKVEISAVNPRLRLTDSDTAASSSTSYLEFYGSDSRSAVVYTNSTGLNIQADAAGGNEIIFLTNGSNERLRIDDTGNVGIGTASPSKTLHVEGSSLFKSTTANGTVNLASTQNLVDAGLKIAFFGANRFETDEEMAYIQPLLVTNNGGAGNVQQGHLAFGTSGSERLRISAGGNVGINSSSPDSKLQVEDFTNFTLNSNTIDYTVFLEGGATAGNGNYGASLGFSRINSVGRTGAIIATKQTSDDADQMGIAFLTHASSSTNTNMVEQMLITHAGNIGIGTATPSYKLTVEHSSAATLSLVRTNGGELRLVPANDNNGHMIRFGGNTDGGAVSPAILRFVGSGDAERIRIASDGDVGIGTASPSQKLDVNGNVRANSYFYGTFFAGRSDTNTHIRMGGSDLMQFTTGNNERMRIDSVGRILINTTTSRAVGDAFTPQNNIFIEGAGSGFYQAFVSVANRNDGSGSVIVLSKTRGTAKGSNTAVQNADILGLLRFAGADGTDLQNNSAEIRVTVDGTVSSNTVPAAIDFRTTTTNSPQTRMHIAADGEIGMGVTDPEAKLHVSGSLLAGGILIEDNSNTSAAPGLEIIGKRSDTNQGISFAPKVVLSKYQTNAKTGAGIPLGAIVFGGNHTDGSESNIAYPACIQAVSLDTFDSITDMPTGLTFRTGSVGRSNLDTANQSVGTERMRLSSAGNLGIGCTNPHVKLEIARLGDNWTGADPVSGTGLFVHNGNNSAQSPAYLTLSAGSSSASAVYFGDDGSSTVGIIKYSHGDNSLRIDVAGAEKLRVTSGGLLGIGLTNPSYGVTRAAGTLSSTSGATQNQFSFESATSNADRLRLITKRTATGSSWETAAHKLFRQVDSTFMGYMQFGSIGTDLITFGEGNSEYMRLNGSGQLSLGTTAAGGKLHVQDVSPILHMQASGSDTAARYCINRFNFQGSTGAEIVAARPSGGDGDDVYLDFRTGGGNAANSRMTISKEGVVTVNSGFVTLNGAKLGAIQVTIADDAFATITPPRIGCGHISVVEGPDEIFPNASSRGLVFADWGNSALVNNISVGTAFETSNLGPPTGTTGSDGHATLFTGGTSGVIYLENRLNTQGIFAINFF